MLKLPVLAGALALCCLAPSAQAGSQSYQQVTRTSIARMSKSQALEVRDHSAQVLRFFDNHRWMLASRHRTCWSGVPWAKTCNRARLTVRYQHGVYRAASARVRRLTVAAMDVPAIIRSVFGVSAVKALSVAACESHYSVHATNGQYFGIFQMGSGERARFGGSSTNPWEQVRAAYRYFSLAGWGPWGCA